MSLNSNAFRMHSVGDPVSLSAILGDELVSCHHADQISRGLGVVAI